MPTIIESAKGAIQQNKNVKKRSPVWWIATIIGLVLIGVAVVGTGVVAVGVYTAQWDGSLVSFVSRAIPLPAVSVNGHWRSYNEFLDAKATLHYSLDQPAVLQASGFTVKPNDIELTAVVIDRMAKEEIVRQLAAKRDVKVTKADIDAEMKNLTDQVGSSENVASQIQKLYRWDIAEFSEKVIQPYLLRQRLQDSIAVDTAINTDEAARVEQLLARVKGGEDFQTIAKEVNEDSTKSSSGDLGIFGKGELDPAIEQAAFALKISETSGIIKTLDGYHIIKLLEKVAADEKAGQGEKVHVAHIFITVEPLDVWLFEQSKSQKIAVFLKGYKWNKDTARVVTTKTSSSNVNATNVNAVNVNASVNSSSNANASSGQ
ncbi:MAG: peptidylprolyl isomerase [Candidatus Kerfeldbacteria bacterium]